MDGVSIPKLDDKSRLEAAPSGSAKALVKGVALVEAVHASGRPLRLGELVEASGLPRPTALRLLEVLLEQRLLHLEDGAYALGSRLAVWGEAYLDGLDLRVHAEDLMRALAEETRETCFLGVLDERMVLYIAKADSPQAVRPAARVGTRNPLHSTGIGKALLAFGPPGVVASYVQGPMPRQTPNTFTDPAHLLDELEATRVRGYAIDDVENEDGVRCVAAPVRDHAGRIVAALSVSAPAYRFALDDLPVLAPRVLAVAGELSRRIGHRDPAHRETKEAR